GTSARRAARQPRPAPEPAGRADDGMRLQVIAAGTRLPDWVNQGVADYAGRLRQDYRLELKEIALGQRSGGAVDRAIAKEGERMLAALSPGAYVVALQ